MIKKNKKIRPFFALILCICMISSIFMMGCSGSSGKDETSSKESYDGKLEYDHSMELKYAKLFSVDYYKGGYKLITIKNSNTEGAVKDEETKILMVPEGMKTPEDTDSKTIVLNLPQTNMLVGSTPVVALMNASGCLDSISQVIDNEWYIDDVKNAINDNKLENVGSYKELDFEKITAKSPTLAIFSNMLDDKTAQKLDDLEIKYFVDQSTYEDNPMGRVEWAKLYAALCDKEDEAEKVVDEQGQSVDSVKKDDSSEKTVAIFYITSKGKIYVRNADDYMTKMVEMAGGKYVLSDLNKEKTGTQAMETEAFYSANKEADCIIYIWSVGGKPQTLADFEKYNEELSDFKAVKEDNVWCTTADFFQKADKLGDMVSDINKALQNENGDDKYTYLWKLK